LQADHVVPKCRVQDSIAKILNCKPTSFDGMKAVIRFVINETPQNDLKVTKLKNR